VDLRNEDESSRGRLKFRADPQQPAPVLIGSGSQSAHGQRSATSKGKTNPSGLAFFACYRVFARVPAGSCGLRREPFLPVTGRFYSPFAHSLFHPPNPV